MKQLSSLDGTAIETWCAELDKCKRRPMTEEEAEIMAKLIIGEITFESVNDMYDKLVTGENMVALIHKRIHYCHTFTAKKSVVVMLSLICDRPAIAVMYTNYLQYKCHQLRVKHVDMKIFAGKIFPWGFFTEEDLRLMWDKQKAISDNSCVNMLDHTELMASIKEIN